MTDDPSGQSHQIFLEVYKVHKLFVGTAYMLSGALDEIYLVPASFHGPLWP